MNPKKELYLKTVHRNLKDKYPEIELSLEELHDIIDSQYTGGIECIVRGLPFRFPNFGSFQVSDKDKLKEGRKKIREKLKKIEEKEKEFKKLNKEFEKQKEFVKITKIQERLINNYKSSSEKRNSIKITTVQDLKSFDKIDNIKTKYDKLNLNETK